RLGVLPGGDQRDRVPEADAQRVDLDVAVGELVLHGLERGERAAELLPRRQVVGGQAQRALRHAELDGRERDAGQPQRGRQGAVAEGLRGRPVEGEVGALSRVVVSAPSQDSPSAEVSTRYRPGAPPAEAATRTWLAPDGVGTTALVPVSAQPSPARTAVQRGAAGSAAPNSSSATVGRADPSSRDGISARCPAVPCSATVSAATTAGQTGTGATTRPCSSRRTARPPT